MQHEEVRDAYGVLGLDYSLREQILKEATEAWKTLPVTRMTNMNGCPSLREVDECMVRLADSDYIQKNQNRFPYPGYAAMKGAYTDELRDVILKTEKFFNFYVDIRDGKSFFVALRAAGLSIPDELTSELAVTGAICNHLSGFNPTIDPSLPREVKRQIHGLGP